MGGQESRRFLQSAVVRFCFGSPLKACFSVAKKDIRAHVFVWGRGGYIEQNSRVPFVQPMAR